MEILSHSARNFAFILLSALFLMGTAQAAALYKWTDEQGNVHYSQSPPQNQKADRMQVKDTPAPQPDEQNGQADNGEQGIPDSAGQDPAEVESRKRNCEIARSNLEIYRTSSRVKQSDGTVIVVSDEMRKAKMEEAQKLIDVFCK